jgi:proteasome lid subunit RPN8/RPN11
MRVSSPPLTLAITGHQYEKIKRHLFPGDGDEAVAIALCGRNVNDRRESLLVREIYLVPHASCRVRSPTRVTWSQETVIPALTRAMNERLAIIKIHSHPSGFQWFSETDDESDLQFFNSVFGWLDTDHRQASLIMMPDGRLVGRAIHSCGLGEPLTEVRVAGDDFIFWRNREIANRVSDSAVRVVQTFGSATYTNLR